MLNVKGRKVLIISTPKGKNWFYHMYNRGFIGNPLYKSFKFISSDNPYSNKNIIQAAKDSIPAALFRQEYLAEFVDNAAIFENVEDLSILPFQSEPIKGEKYYAGVDIALKNDYNVTVIFNERDELVFMDRVKKISAPDLKERLVGIFNKWKPKKIYIEENNQGLPIIQDLQKLHNIDNIVGFLTTTKSKPIIINQLINAFASKAITVLDSEEMKLELGIFTMTISNTGHVSYSAPSGFNDDIVMAIAIGWECLQKNKGTDVLQVIKIGG